MDENWRRMSGDRIWGMSSQPVELFPEVCAHRVETDLAEVFFHEGECYCRGLQSNFDGTVTAAALSHDVLDEGRSSSR